MSTIESSDGRVASRSFLVFPVSGSFDGGIVTQTCSSLLSANGIIACRLSTITPQFTYPALTTAYSAPPFCANRWLLQDPNVATIYSQASGDDFYTSCQPAETAPTYSPGMCPSGHTVASITELSASGSSTAEIDRVWRGLCCRSGMTLSDNTHCASSFTAGHTAYAPMTDSDNPTRRYFDKPTAIIGVEGISLGVSALGDIYSNDITTLASGMALADPIAVFWQTSDIAEVFPSAYAASVARQVAATEVSSSQTTGASPSSKSNLATQTGTSTADPADRSSNDLSTGAKAGIAIGVVLGVALVALGVLLLFRRRRKQKLARDTPVGQVPEMGDTGHGKRLMGGQWRAEAQAEEKAQELDSRGVHVMNDFPVEIDSSGRTPDARHM